MIPISKQQILIFKEIRKTYPDARLNYPIHTRYGVRYGDIVLIPQHIVVEVDSDFWHQNKLRDYLRDKALKEVGWKTIRVKEGEIIESQNNKGY